MTNFQIGDIVVPRKNGEYAYSNYYNDMYARGGEVMKIGTQDGKQIIHVRWGTKTDWFWGNAFERFVPILRSHPLTNLFKDELSLKEK